jgi:hypothetical protein
VQSIAVVARHCGDLLEVSVVVQDDRALVFGNCGGQHIHYSCGTVLPASRHPELDLPCLIGDLLGNRQVR